MTDKQVYVVIRNFKTGDESQRMGPMSEWQAHHVVVAVLADLNTESYCVDAEPVAMTRETA